jgi:hypothetical protein
MTVEMEEKLDQFAELVSILRKNVTDGVRPVMVEVIESEIQSVLADIRYMNTGMKY